jgi:hypothetical protein
MGQGTILELNRKEMFCIPRERDGQEQRSECERRVNFVQNGTMLGDS